MLDIRRRTGILFFVALLGHIVLISAQVHNRSGVPVLEAVTFGVFSEVQRGTAYGVGGVRSVWDEYFALRGVQQQNDQLKQQVAALQLELQKQRAQAQEGERLRTLLGLRDQLGFRTLAARVIASDATYGYQTVTIGKGSNEGVVKDQAVLGAGGVVGRVIRTGAHAAMVQLLIDQEAAAGALIERSRSGGVVAGASGDPPLRLEYLPNLADVRAGDRVVTSGLDGIYPKGFLIGRVEALERGAGLYKSIRVRPAVDFSRLEEVLVVLDRPEAPPLAEAGA